MAINIDVAFWGGVFSLHHEFTFFQRSRIILGFSGRIVNIFIDIAILAGVVNF